MLDQPRICLVSASGQNVFFAEILDAFGITLQEHGFIVEKSVDCFPALADDLVYLFIPHEYQPMVHEAAHPSEAQLRRSIALGTEQPGTNWFETVAEIAARAGAVIDINALGARELNRRGIAAEHAPLGYVPAWDVWRGGQGEHRSIDMAFLGRHTERRARALARCAPVLGRRRSAIYLTETVRPHTAGSPYFLAGERRARLLADSKVLLNVHQQELAYMEWHRVLSAVLNGCVVLSEHSLAIEPLEPGEHFVSASYDDLPQVLDGLLSDPDRQARIRHAAYDLVRDEMPMTRAFEALLQAVERLARAPIDATSPTSPPPAPMPMALPDRQPEWEAHATWLGDRLPERRALKHLVVRMRELERRVDELSADGPAADTVERLGPPGTSVPRVSVLLTVHDYADLVGDALRSIALSDFDDVEVVAVDDGSTDGSAEAVRAACSELPWLSVRLVRRNRNSGLPAIARNVALAHARADLVFVLDADNAVFPQGLGRLTQALDDEPGAAFSYGILQTFDVRGPVGLRSWMDWSPDRLKYGNYVDAMATIRRSALDAVGGYPTDAALVGWEDFALWVALADANLGGVRVPELVGRYRVSPHSMIALADIDHSEAWATLLRRHSVLTDANRSETGSRIV